MTTLSELKRKYSSGPIPQWELDALEGKAPDAEPRKRGRKSKPDVTEEQAADGDSDTDSDPSA